MGTLEDIPKLLLKMDSILAVICDFIKLLWFTICSYTKSWYRVFKPPPPKSLQGEVILLTGAANGIGREVCQRLANSGATLICWDIQDEANRELEQDLKNRGCTFYIFTIDISDRSAVEAAAKKIRKEIGRVTILINNAAVMPCHSFLGHNPRELERVFQVNVLAQFWILREFLPHMISANKGHIVTTCSAAGIMATRNMVPYCGTKHAVHGYIEALKDEIGHMPGKPDIKFTTVYPFSVRTGLTQGVKCFSRFPSILPILTPQAVAEKLVEGLLREYEYVYVPNILRYLGNHAKSLLPEVQRAAADFTDPHIEPEDHHD